MFYGSKRRKLFEILFLILCTSGPISAIQNGKLMFPSRFTALSGDLHMQLQLQDSKSILNSETLIQVNYHSTNVTEVIDEFPLNPDPRNNVTQFKIECAKLYRGGSYEIEVINKSKANSSTEIVHRLKEELHVKWPIGKLFVNRELIGTYPDEPIEVNLTFPEVDCSVADTDINVSEFWLELVYCGQVTMDCNHLNKSKTLLYAEQIRGFPKSKIIALKCDLFGLAGYYMIRLRAVAPTPSFVTTNIFLKADWNEKFVFNVHTRSILPCDPHSGIGVLFEYPKCILDQADRVRIFSKLRADVASLKPPTTMHYITEQRVNKGQHSMNFECDFFSEKYIEYCFVYVTQALSGAVADIRTDCVPTLSVTDADIGGWGAWSEWTPCSTTCMSGTRNRYRFCDSPPPRYGAKFCEVNKNFY